MKIAEKENDFVSRIVTGMWLGVYHSYNFDFEKAVNAFQPGVDICVMVKSLWGVAAQKAQQAFFGYLFPGNLSTYTDLAGEALKIAEDSGDPFSMGISNTAYGWACFNKGYLHDAVKYLQRGRDLCQRVAFLGWAGNALDCLAQTYFSLAQYEKARQCLLTLQRSFTEARINPSAIRQADLFLARIGMILGEKDVDLARLRTIAEKVRGKLWEGQACACLGEILLNLGSQYFLEAEQWIQKAIEADAGNGMKIRLAWDHALYGEFFKHRGDRAQKLKMKSPRPRPFSKSVAQMDGWNNWRKNWMGFHIELILISIVLFSACCLKRHRGIFFRPFSCVMGG